LTQTENVAHSHFFAPIINAAFGTGLMVTQQQIFEQLIGGDWHATVAALRGAMGVNGYQLQATQINAIGYMPENVQLEILALDTVVQQHIFHMISALRRRLTAQAGPTAGGAAAGGAAAGGAAGSGGCPCGASERNCDCDNCGFWGCYECVRGGRGSDGEQNWCRECIGALHIPASINSIAFLPYHPCNFHAWP
jgi:hypothetical protein